MSSEIGGFAAPGQETLAAQTDGEVIDYEVRVVDHAGQPLPVGVEGELCARGPSLFVGYADPDSPGGRLKAAKPGEKFIFSPAAGEMRRLCEVEDFNLTAHANREDLLDLVGEVEPRVVLLSSRYHLARCALLARWLGYDYALCAAEPRLDWRPATLWRIACEAAWVCWIDVGARWARLAGHRGMLAKVS